MVRGWGTSKRYDKEGKEGMVKKIKRIWKGVFWPFLLIPLPLPVPFLPQRGFPCSYLYEKKKTIPFLLSLPSLLYPFHPLYHISYSYPFFFPFAPP